MKTRFLICLDRISGRGGNIPIETLGSEEEECGGGDSVKDMAVKRNRGKVQTRNRGEG